MTQRRRIAKLLRRPTDLAEGDGEDESKLNNLTHDPMLSLDEVIYSWLNGTDGSPLQEYKLARCDDSHCETVDVEEDSSIIAEIGDAAAQRNSLLPHMPQMMEYLTTDLPWKWLQKRIRVLLTCSHWPADIADAVFEALTSANNATAANQCSATFVVDWHPQRYLSEHFGPEAAHKLGDTITLTGRDDQLIAATCKEYLADMWDVVGTKLLSALQAWMDDNAAGRRRGLCCKS
jgi:hypothetical protein